MSPPGACTNILNARSKAKGIGTISNPERFLNQDFQQLKQYCLTKAVRYIDEMFPPDRRSIGPGILSAEELKRVVWLRPIKMVPSPSFSVDGMSRFDFGQGVIGNCWFLASIGALTFQRPILEQVVPLDQSFDEEYCGLFHFRFWRFGKWIDVVIDDKLPTINGRLLFVQSKTPNEFWPALLEKAYAKVCGSYSDMNAGSPAEALVDFTGGVHICVQLSDPPLALWELMFRAGKSKSLMGCGTQGETSANRVLSNGLVQGHAYTVTGVKQLMSQGRQVNLVRLWNPWGQGEWNGDWSDESRLWNTVSSEDREMCHHMQNDGEFWMALEDFCRFFADLDICCLCPDFLDGSSSCHWRSSCYEGRWVAGITAGGCINNIESFWTNPQYRVKVDKLLSECSSSDNDKTMLVSLMQKPDKRNRRLVQNLHIGFSVFEVTDEYKSHTGKFPASFFQGNTPVGQSKTYVNAREVMELMALKPGEYLIVPSTFNPNETASYLLTILSKAETHVHENSERHDHDNEHAADEVCCRGDGPSSHSNFGDQTAANVLQTNTPDDNGTDDSSKESDFNEFSDEYDEVDAEQLQKLLNERILNGDLKSGGFSTDACRSMVALMDTSVTGKLNRREFLRLWRKILALKVKSRKEQTGLVVILRGSPCVNQDIFVRTDDSNTGTLPLNKLRNAVEATGNRLNDDLLNLMALRYGSTSGSPDSGVITLENFISLMLRWESMNQIFSQLSDGLLLTLQKAEWVYLYMYG
ncbi:calpain-1 catalytic subunit-like isoform X2 [Takifugu flavidus]|uniref:calpain-1 catalytic subunit-like isoform X2 n=1 Tax=Takifugu flavidus TaxID=433684 RepID=UPI00254406AE|nr:calpain-1 catalytic subunit-like isoform X2 [Takifugu flavidus]